MHAHVGHVGTQAHQGIMVHHGLHRISWLTGLYVDQRCDPMVDVIADGDWMA